MKKSLILFLTILSAALISCQQPKFNSVRETINLAGTWHFSTDDKYSGEQEKWFINELTDSIVLPGSMDENKKGNINRDTTDYHLNRKYVYTGPAWYQKEIEIPESWNGKHIELFLERTKVSKIWIDSTFIDSSDMIFTPQIFNISGKISAGKHLLTIMIDNTEKLVPVEGSHAYSEDTQTNWNGILGKITLTASSQARIENVRITPDIESGKVMLKLNISAKNQTLNDAVIKLQALLKNSKESSAAEEKSYSLGKVNSDTTIYLTYEVGKNADLWSEFGPTFYSLITELTENSEVIDNRQTEFGMRKFSTRDKQFTINGKTTFLRGEHNACVFPLTGYPPMDKEGWLKVYNTAKEYGINHFRFHSWTPPEAAFEAADIAGIYLQPELPIWWSFKPEDKNQMDFMLRTGEAILSVYGNHPSFVMFALGNEVFQDRDSITMMVNHFRNFDPRPLYAQGSNNRGGDPSYAPGDDYWTSFRTGKEQPDLSTDVRTSISFVDSKEGGILNTIYPNTTFNYTKAISNSPVPVIGHEIGQYQIYPPYKTEMPKYTGILEPRNFEIFRQRLIKAGMGDEAEAFFKASGSLAAECYKADIETAIRTPHFGGFQLLDLQDYPGQGTALVGILDAFWENKGLITPDKFRQFCDRVVVLGEFEKYCWTSGEKFNAAAVVANYGENRINGESIKWELVKKNDSTVAAEGTLASVNIDQGTVLNCGKIEFTLPDNNSPGRYDLKLKMLKTGKTNEYPVWVFPAVKPEVPANIIVSKELDSKTKQTLENGGTVLLTPDFNKIKDKSLPGQFIPEFWNWKMFTMLAKRFGGQVSPGTMSILVNPDHPLFKNFPTEFHADWQWWTILKHSRPVILDDTKPDYRPIIQMIDNIDRNHKLGVLFEFKCEKGKILVCPVDFDGIKDKPEGSQFIEAVNKYIESDKFNPAEEIDFNGLKELL